MYWIYKLFLNSTVRISLILAVIILNWLSWVKLLFVVILKWLNCGKFNIIIDVYKRQGYNDGTVRYLTSNVFQCRLANCETLPQTWLIYSETTCCGVFVASVYCFQVKQLYKQSFPQEGLMTVFFLNLKSTKIL